MALKTKKVKTAPKTKKTAAKPKAAKGKAARPRTTKAAVLKPKKFPANETKAKTDTSSRQFRLALDAAKSTIDKKSLNTVVLDVSNLGTFTDFFVISSGMNERQVQAMADEVTKKFKHEGLMPRVEGYQEGRWILVDAGDIVVHLFHETIREFYRLEELWDKATRVEIPQEFYTSRPSSA